MPQSQASKNRSNAHRRQVAAWKREAAAKRHTLRDPEMQAEIKALLTEVGEPMRQHDIEVALKPGFCHGWASQHLGDFLHCTVKQADGRFALRVR